ncbi:hypothetical protein QCN27_11645 [Cereibacter sp. SYSU M97828]|nr:hypothetical protein [Cereibacter flavus]
MKLAALFFLLPTMALAEPRTCTTSVSGLRMDLFYEPNDEELSANRSYREALTGRFGDGCPGYVTLRHLTPDLTDAQRSPFCLQWDEGAQTYAGYAEGPRDAYLACRKPSRSFCERVNASVGASRQVAGLAAQTADTVATINGATAAVHPGGAVVLSGATSAVSGAIGTAGTAASAALATPVGLAAAAVSVVAVGGALYVCSE